MIIDFTVENYRSIKTAMTLSAIAANSKKTSSARERYKVDDDICSPFTVEGQSFGILPVLAIYGANASGKSNVLSALNSFLSYITYGSSSRRGLIPVIPFLLDDTTHKSSTNFEIRISLKNGIYVYAVSVTRSQVLQESLMLLRPHAKRKTPQVIFERQWNSEEGSYTWTNSKDFLEIHQQLQVNLNKSEFYLSFLHRLQLPFLQDLP